MTGRIGLVFYCGKSGGIVGAHNANRKLADKKWLTRRYVRDAVTVNWIAEESGTDPSQVYRALQRHGIELRGRLDVDNRKLTAAAIERAYKQSSDTAYLSPNALGNRAAAARLLGVSHQKLLGAERRLGLAIHPRGLEARKLYESGLSRRATGTAMGLSDSTRLLLGTGVTMRPRGRPKTFD
jgi:hypothetical protein